MEKYPAKC